MTGNYQNGGGNGAGGDDSAELFQLLGQIGGMAKWIAIIVGVVVLFSLVVFARSVYTDLLWFDNLGFRGVFVKALLTRIGLFAAGAAVMAALMGGSLFAAHRLSRGDIALALPDAVLGFMSRALRNIGIGATVALSAIFGSIFAAQWETFLRFSNSSSFGHIEQVFNRDAGFYVFTLPVLNFLQGALLGMLIVTLIGTAAIYFLHVTLRGDKFDLSEPAVKIHLSVIAALIMFTIGLGHWLERWELLLSTEGAVFGAAYTDVSARMPAMLVMTIIAFAAGGLMLANTYFSGRRLLVGAFALWFVMNIVLGNVWPGFIQQFRVNPNEFVREAEYIDRNIRFTRQAFALDRVSEESYPADSLVDADVIARNPKTVNNIRLWDYRPLSDVYKQIQLIRPYYDFRDADVDRYTINGELRQVLLSAREVAPEKLQEGSQTWINTRLVYTHGMGIAMSPVTEFTPEGRPEFFAQDIPSDGVIPIQAADSPTPDLQVTNPRIYYGENAQNYVIVNTQTDELDYQTEDGDLFRTNYFGSGGVQLSSVFRRMAYAWQFGDINILISGQITGDSRLQYRSQIQERVQEVAPFLLLDNDPYIVAADDGKLYWIQDAYTYTDRYPYSDPLAGFDLNYMRNSVKVAIDAFDGDMQFYIWDEADPIILTYSRIFPQLFTAKSAMPESLQAHVRYPQDFFRIQAEKYIRYHMQDPQNFYSNEDLWAVAEEKFGQGDELQQVEPYYVIMKLPGEDKEEFLLLLPYTPNERQNLIGWLAARSDGENYGGLIAFNFPKNRQVDGPAQVEARIDNDQDISAWFTLRCTEGSSCIRGNLLVIPVEDALVYAEPVYIRAEGVAFPELKRVILATSDKVVMEDTLEEALAELTGTEVGAAAAAATNGADAAPQPSAAGGDGVQTLRGAIDEVKKTLADLERALDKLTESLGDDQ